MKSIRYSLVLLALSVLGLHAQTQRLVLTITPPTNPAQPLVIQTGQTVQFSATAWSYASATGAPTQVQISSLQWSVSPAGMGTITGAGLYTAPSGLPANVVPQVHITAVAQVQGMTITSSVIATITGPPVVTPLDYTITGTVTNASHAAVANASVLIQSLAAAGAVGSSTTVTTDAQGVYTAKVAAGVYVVRASAAGYLPLYYDNQSSFANATHLVTDPTKKTMSGIDFVLSQGGVISGTVVEDAHGTPVANALVQIVLRNSPTSNAPLSARTDASGAYHIDGLPAGDYVVLATAQGYLAQYYDKQSSATLATQVHVSLNATTSGIDFRLLVFTPNTTTLYSIHGRVTDAGANGIANATVSALPPIGTMPPVYVNSTVLTDRNGYYHLRIPAGTYVVKAVAQGYETEYYDNTPDATLAKTVSISAQDTSRTGIDFSLARIGGSIAGVVTDAANNPIAGAKVRVWGAPSTTRPPVNSAGFYGTAVTQSNGTYIVSGLAQGSYYVAVDAAGYLSEYYDNASVIAQATPVPVAQNQAVTGIDFALAPGGSISGTITDLVTLQPIPNAFVSVQGSATTPGRTNLGVRTNALGQYTINGLATGSYTVFAAAPGHAGRYYHSGNSTTATPVAVTAPNAVTRIDIALDTATTNVRHFTGTVVDAASNAPLTLTTVEAIDPVTGATLLTTTDMNGHYDLYAAQTAVVRVRAIRYIGLYSGSTRNWKESGWSGFAGSEEIVALSPISENGMAVLDGHVLATQSTVANAWVYGTDAYGNTFFSVTGADGAYELTRSDGGTMDMLVSSVRYEPAQSATTLNGAHGSFDMNTQLTGTATATGTPASATGIILGQNYPNPFNPSTVISYTLPAAANVVLIVRDCLGRTVGTLMSGRMNAGSHSVVWNAGNLPSGVYFYSLQTEAGVMTRAMTLAK